MAVRLSRGVRVTGEQAKTGPYKEFGLFPADMRSHCKCLGRKGQEQGWAGEDPPPGGWW